MDFHVPTPPRFSQRAFFRFPVFTSGQTLLNIADLRLRVFRGLWTDMVRSCLAILSFLRLSSFLLYVLLLGLFGLLSPPFRVVALPTQVFVVGPAASFFSRPSKRLTRPSRTLHRSSVFFLLRFLGQDPSASFFPICPVCCKYISVERFFAFFRLLSFQRIHTRRLSPLSPSPPSFLRHGLACTFSLPGIPFLPRRPSSYDGTGVVSPPPFL